jgi:hydroxymethylpyrimidine pyrophosphatase-like HAD family hydrolase
MVITDLDGSFWGPELRCHGATLDALAELQRREVDVLVATGRRERSARNGLLANDVMLPAVLLNGALGVDLPADVRFHSRPFQPAEAAAVVESLATIGISPVVYTEDGLVRGDRDVSTGERHRKSFGADFVVEDPFATVRARPILSFSMIGMSRDQIEPAVAALADVPADSHMYEDHLYQAWSLHIQPEAISKWDGVQAYLDYVGKEPERIIAIGDGTNDLELLANAHVALGVSGGHANALALADHVLAAPDDGGWAAVLDHL